MAAASKRCGARGPEQTSGEEEGDSAVDLEPEERSREIGRRPTGGDGELSSGDFRMLGMDWGAPAPDLHATHSIVLPCLQLGGWVPTRFPFSPSSPLLKVI